MSDRRLGEKEDKKRQKRGEANCTIVLVVVSRGMKVYVILLLAQWSTPLGEPSLAVCHFLWYCLSKRHSP